MTQYKKPCEIKDKLHLMWLSSACEDYLKRRAKGLTSLDDDASFVIRSKAELVCGRFEISICKPRPRIVKKQEIIDWDIEAICMGCYGPSQLQFNKNLDDYKPKRRSKEETRRFLVSCINKIHETDNGSVDLSASSVDIVSAIMQSSSDGES